MKYFLDTEFIEGFHKPLFCKRRHFIDLISIGIVCEDGRSYYAISNEFDPADADDWVQKNVLAPMVVDWVKTFSENSRNWILDSIGKGIFANTRKMQASKGKPNKQIAEEILDFINYGHHKDHTGKTIDHNGSPLEFYGYYADYDWVLFCSLFGRMIDLPKGFPVYMRDLKQMLDEKQALMLSDRDFRNGKTSPLTASPNYPKQTHEHNALCDAKWNKELYHFL